MVLRRWLVSNILCSKSESSLQVRVFAPSLSLRSKSESSLQVWVFAPSLSLRHKSESSLQVWVFAPSLSLRSKFRSKFRSMRICGECARWVTTRGRPDAFHVWYWCSFGGLFTIERVCCFCFNFVVFVDLVLCVVIPYSLQSLVQSRAGMIL